MFSHKSARIRSSVGVALTLTAVLSIAPVYHRTARAWGGSAGSFMGTPSFGTQEAADHSNSDLWQSQPNAVADNTFHHIWASSVTNIWASGNAGLLLHSEDDGASWDRFNVGIRYSQNNLFGVWGDGDKKIWLCGTNGLILHSPNGGGDFIPQSSGVNWRLQAIWGQETHGDGIEGEDSNVDIFVGGDNGTVLHSADGETWTQLSLPKTDFDVWGIWSIDDEVYATGSLGRIFHSSDHGVTWEQQVSGLSLANTIENVWGTSTDDVYASAPGGVLHTVNHGTTWTKTPFPLGVTSDTITYSGTGLNDVWAVNGGGFIFHSVDGGLTWVKQVTGTTTSVLGVWALDTDNVIVLGREGLILRTTNGGLNWNVVPAETVPSRFAAFVISDTTAFVTGGVADVLKTTDGGETWNVSRIQQSLMTMLSLWGTGLDMWAAGLNRIGHSTDGGATWKPVTTLVLPSKGFVAFNGVGGTSPLDVFIVGVNGWIFHSSNNGVTWQQQITGTTAALNSIWAAGAGELFVVGEGGTILHSSNGGATWTAQNSTSDKSLFSVFGTSSTDVWAAGNEGVLLHSTDGATWVQVDVGTALDLRSVSAATSGDVYVVGERGIIFHITPEGEIRNEGHNPGLGRHGADEGADLFGVSVSPSGAVIYAVGYNGTILRR